MNLMVDFVRKHTLLSVLVIMLFCMICGFALWTGTVYVFLYCLNIAFNFGITFNLVFGIATATFLLNLIFKFKKQVNIGIDMYDQLKKIGKRS